MLHSFILICVCGFLICQNLDFPQQLSLYNGGSHCHLWLPFLCLNELLIFIHTNNI